MSPGGTTFDSYNDILKVIRLYMQLTPSCQSNLYSVINKSDTKSLGVANKEEFVEGLKSLGIKFGRVDQRNFEKWLPKDKLGLIRYEDFYLELRSLSSTQNQTDMDSSNLEGAQGRRNRRKGPMIPRKGARTDKTDGTVRSQNIVEEERNIDILKRRLDDKMREIKKLNNQLSSWKEKALKYEEDWKKMNNKNRSGNNIRTLSSEMDPNIPNQKSGTRIVRELEGELVEAKRKIDYECEVRDSKIGYLEEELALVGRENESLSSEIDVLRR